MNKMWWVFTLPPDELTRLSTTRITDDHPRKSHSEGKKWKQTIVEGCFSLPCCRIITTISHVSFQYIESLSNPQPPPKGWKFTFFSGSAPSRRLFTSCFPVFNFFFFFFEHKNERKFGKCRVGRSKEDFHGFSVYYIKSLAVDVEDDLSQFFFSLANLIMSTSTTNLLFRLNLCVDDVKRNYYDLFLLWMTLSSSTSFVG